jgi:hypothetical protein
MPGRSRGRNTSAHLQTSDDREEDLTYAGARPERRRVEQDDCVIAAAKFIPGFIMPPCHPACMTCRSNGKSQPLLFLNGQHAGWPEG